MTLVVIVCLIVLGCSFAALIGAAHYCYSAQQYAQAAASSAAACAAAHDEDDAEPVENGRHLSLAPSLRAAED